MNMKYICEQRQRFCCRYLLQKLGDVLAAALGPEPRAGVVVERGRHDVELVLDARLLALWVVIMGHVEPGPETYTL